MRQTDTTLIVQLPVAVRGFRSVKYARAEAAPGRAATAGSRLKGFPVEVREDLLDHRQVPDARDDPHRRSEPFWPLGLFHVE
jgi:hypothetical protein